MSVWNSLWAADTPTKTITNGLNPQGNLAAPVGTMAVRTCDGSIYVKRGGGSTAYGWYLVDSDQFINWQPRFTAASGVSTINASGQNLLGGGNTLINFLPFKSGSGAPFSPKRQYVGGYTSAAALNQIFWALATSVQNVPTQAVRSALTDITEYDLWWDVITTPRSSPTATTTDMTSIRIWAGGVWGSGVLQTAGGSVSSDTLATEWPIALSAVAGLFGAAFRFSTVAGDSGWKMITTNAPGGVYSQTVTDMNVTAVADTFYRLRQRVVISAGVVTLFASINDGTEIAITANVGAGVVAAANPITPFQPLASFRSIAGGPLKSLCIAQCAMNYGTGVGDC